MLAILAPILVFGLVIFVHELGHFLAAKMTGVYAPRFSIGFGPALWRHRWGETEYVLAALPLGGYVRMASRLDGEMSELEGGNEDRAARHEGEEGYDPDALVPFGPRPVPEHRLFESKPLVARLLILLAGVSMNVLLAFVVLVALVLHYGHTIIPTRVVGEVRAPASAPALAQLRVGDTIMAVNGTPVSSWNDISRQIAMSQDTITIRTQREQVRVPLGRGGAAPTAEDVLGAVDFFVAPVLDTIIPGEPAQAAGFQPGDSIVAIDGHPVRTWSDLVDQVSHSPGQALTVSLVRGGAPRSLTVTPRPTATADSESGATTTVGKIGAGPRLISDHERLGLGAAVIAGGKATWVMGGTIVEVVKRLLVGQISVRQLSGPVGITRMSVEAARSGLESLFTLIAFLSINVAILNLFPVPILDGGQIAINVLESAKGKPFSLRTREYILRFGLLAIALLFVVVMYNDTHSWIGRLVGWVARLFGGA